MENEKKRSGLTEIMKVQKKSEENKENKKKQKKREIMKINSWSKIKCLRKKQKFENLKEM